MKIAKEDSTGVPAGATVAQRAAGRSERRSFTLRAMVALLLGLAAGIGTFAGFSASAANHPAAPAGVSRAVQTEKPRALTDYDIRLLGKAEMERLLRSGSQFRSVGEAADVALRNSLKIKGGLDSLRANRPGAKLKISPLTASTEMVDGDTAGLTEARPGASGESITRNFISANREIYGLGDSDIANLRFIGESKPLSGGLRMVRVEQMIDGLPVFQSETRFVLDRDGRLIRSLGLMVPTGELSAEPIESSLSAQEALRRTMAQLDIDLGAAEIRLVDEKQKLRVEMRVADRRVTGKVTSKMVYFPIAPGVLIPAWSQIIFGEKADWYVLVDARDGTMLWRKNLRMHTSAHNARFRVYVQADGSTPADSPAPQSPSSAQPFGGTQYPEIAPTIVSMFAAQNLLASPNGWIDDCPAGICTINQTQTAGNNIRACIDRTMPAFECDTDPAGVIDGNGSPTGNPDSNGRNRDFLGIAPRDFETGFRPAPVGGDPEGGQTATGDGASGTNALDSFRRGSVTQAFYTANWYHDKLFMLGFDEGAGNYQKTNFSGQGLGDDPIDISVQNVFGTDNAFFVPTPDGIPGRTGMFRYIGPDVDRDASLDAEILIHELTHGTAYRLVGNATGLTWGVGRSISEGWSDFYALSLLNNTNADNPNGTYPYGAYVFYKVDGMQFADNYVYGSRRFPYSTNNSVNPLTWADVDEVTNDLSGGIPGDPYFFNFYGAMEFHNAGEIWANTLWEVRSRVIAANGGSVATGNQKTLQFVTDGMKLTPAEPTFIEARDAIIAADCNTTGCANEDSIWAGFADRGLGYGASAPLTHIYGFYAGHLGVRESFLTPNLDVNSVTVSDTIGNNSGAPDPNEPIKITVNLKNPFRRAARGVPSATATLTSTSPEVVITDGSSTYPAIAASSSASGDTFQVKVPASAGCGQSLNFRLTISSSLGTVSRDFTLRVGTPNGTAAPITYSSDPNPDIPIPEFVTVRGVGDAMAITDDYEIADINFRADKIQHTFPGDISVMLRAPNGYGTSLISLIGGITDGGPGDDIVNMVVDDDIPNTAANDMAQTTEADAPYTKSWQPVFNSPWSIISSLASPDDPVGQLSRLDGTSTKGTWHLRISDQGFLDGGALDKWSIIVTPRAFACTPFSLRVTGNIKQFVAFGTNIGLQGVTLHMTDATTSQLLSVTTTDSSGNYAFDIPTAGQNIVITPSGLGKTYEAMSRTYANVTANVTGADFVAYNILGANAVPRTARVVSQPATAGSSVTVPILMTSTGVERKIAFTVHYTTGPLGIPTAACGSSIPGCSVMVDNSLPDRTGITITPAGALAAGVNEIVRVTFPTSSGSSGAVPIRFGDFPTARNVQNAEGNPLPTLYWTDGQVSFAGGTLLDGGTIEGRVLTPAGQGLRNATVVLTDAVGTRWTTTTSSFGTYKFEGLEPGRTYLLQVSSRRYRFVARSLLLADNLSGLDLIGLE